MLAACSQKKNSYSVIELTNTLDFDRTNELVCVELETEGLGDLVDENGISVPYQVTDKGIIFLADVDAKSTKTFTFDSTKPAVTPNRMTSAFFLGDRRKDDFAFENDKAGYRMYGPALLPENPSNGVDLWLKHIPDPVMDDMYKQEENGQPYHIDYGLGIDSYKVGHAVGCGGVALVYNDKLWVGGPFAKWEILKDGPLQTIFRLDYDSILVGETILKETITVTVNAGSLVNKAEVIFSGISLENLYVGGGIFLHNDDSNKLNTGYDYISYAETATSDKGIYNIHANMGLDANELDFGRNYVSVIVPGMEKCELYNETEVALKSYKVGETFTYYFGGGWSKRDYDTDQEWFEATEKTVQALSYPLKITLK